MLGYANAFYIANLETSVSSRICAEFAAFYYVIFVAFVRLIGLCLSPSLYMASLGFRSLWMASCGFFSLTGLCSVSLYMASCLWCGFLKPLDNGLPSNILIHTSVAGPCYCCYCVQCLQRSAQKKKQKSCQLFTCCTTPSWHIKDLQLFIIFTSKPAPYPPFATPTPTHTKGQPARQ